MKITLENKGIGRDERNEIREMVSQFVLDNWETLRVGADKLKNVKLIPSDYYAPERIQIEDTRLHERTGLKYANGCKYDSISIDEKDLKKAIQDIKILLEEASKVVKCSFKLEIKEV